MPITTSRAIAGLVVFVLIGGAGFSMRPKPLAVDTGVIRRGALETTIDADGRTRVRNKYLVVAPVSGRLERITNVEGAIVRAGDVVARIAPLPIDSATLLLERARVDAAVALAREAQSQVTTLGAVLEQRRRELSRANRLAEVGGVPPRIVEEAQLAVVQAEEALTGAQHREWAAGADVRQAKAALTGREGQGGGAVLVHAPASGRVLRVPERSERIVAAGTPLLEVGDPTSLEIVVDVLSSDGSIIRPGDGVRLAGWGADTGEHRSQMQGRVRDVEPSGFTKVSALGVEEQRVNVVIDPERVPRQIGDGFRVEATIVVWSGQDVLLVPRSALLPTSAAGWSVFMVSDGRVARRTVRVGRVGAGEAQILDGIAEGDRVVLFPSDQVVPGVRVTSARTRQAWSK